MTRHWKLISALMLLSVVGNFVEAATVTVSWTNPTTNTDGSAIPASGAGSLTSVRLEYGTCGTGGTFGTKAGEVTRNMPVTTTTLNLNPGTSCVRAFVSNTYGAESAASNVLTHVVNPPVPNPPQLNTISAAVYEPKANFHAWTFERGKKVSGSWVKIGASCEEDRCVSDSREGNFCVISRLTQVTPRPKEGTVVLGLCG